MIEKLNLSYEELDKTKKDFIVNALNGLTKNGTFSVTFNLVGEKGKQLKISPVNNGLNIGLLIPNPTKIWKIGNMDFTHKIEAIGRVSFTDDGNLDLNNSDIKDFQKLINLLNKVGFIVREREVKNIDDNGKNYEVEHTAEVVKKSFYEKISNLLRKPNGDQNNEIKVICKI